MVAIRRCLFPFLTLVCAAAACGAQVRLFAAASLADALAEIEPRFTAATGDGVRVNLGGSGLLARQIREGAPVDVFFSADELRVDELERDGFLQTGTRRILLSNALVLIGPVPENAAVSSFADLATAAVKRIAIGEPETVPAGTYAREHLQRLHLWSAVTPKLVPMDNVRAVLAAVAAGNADAGIVYHTDALIGKGVRVIVAVPPTEGPRIVYSAAVLKDSTSPDAARTLLDYLASDAAQEVFVRHGFSVWLLNQ